MQIHFTRHAEEKFEVLARHGWAIDRKKVEDTMHTPAHLDHSRSPLTIAQADLDEHHVLRVVYRQEGNTAVVITFYPGRKSQYATHT